MQHLCCSTQRVQLGDTGRGLSARATDSPQGKRAASGHCHASHFVMALTIVLSPGAAPPYLRGEHSAWQEPAEGLGGGPAGVLQHSPPHGFDASVHGVSPGREVAAVVQGPGGRRQEEPVELWGQQPHHHRGGSGVRGDKMGVPIRAPSFHPALTTPEEPPIFSSSRSASAERSWAGAAGGGRARTHSWMAAGQRGKKGGCGDPAARGDPVPQWGPYFKAWGSSLPAEGHHGAAPAPPRGQLGVS